MSFIWCFVYLQGVPLLLVSTFLSAMDNSWKEKVTIGSKGISANEILFNINLVAIGILFIYLTIFSSEYMEATYFLFGNPSALIWMILRGISYSLWIHFSVVLIQQAGALINQYVSASRKLFSVILSFIMFGRPFYFMHGVGFLFFALACLLKISMAQRKSDGNNDGLHPKSPKVSNDIDNNNSFDAILTKASDTDSDIERNLNKDEQIQCDRDEFRSFPIPTTMTYRKEKKSVELFDDQKDKEYVLTMEETESGSYEEKKQFDGYGFNVGTTTNRIGILA